MRQRRQLLQRIIVDSGVQKPCCILAGMKDSEEDVIDAEDRRVGERNVGGGGEGAVCWIAWTSPCGRVDYFVVVFLQYEVVS